VPAEPEELTLDVPGLRLAARAWGPADGRPVLALHGWLDNAASFDRLAPLLEGARVVALDLPGHGLSDHRPPGVAYHFVDWPVDVHAATEALGWARYGLLAHSMGAGVACLLAGAVPERVERLVLIEGLGPLAVPPEEAPTRLARSLAQRAGREARAPKPHPDRSSAAARLRQVNTGLSEEAARLLVARGTRELPDGGVTWRSDPRLRGLSPMRTTEEHVLAFLGRIACPTLVVRGRGGYAFDPVALEARFRRLRDARLLELDGGHHLHLEDPAAVAAAAGPFLTGAAAPAPATPAATSSEVDVALLVLDVDGVLTDGGVRLDADGREGKRFDVQDGLGIKLLQKAGVAVAIITGRSSEAVAVRARELGIERVHQGVTDKVAVLDGILADLGLEPRQAAYMGDDLPDLGPLRRVGFPAAPANAVPEVRRLVRHVTRAAGGRGAVRELAQHLLEAQGRWAAMLSQGV